MTALSVTSRLIRILRARLGTRRTEDVGKTAAPRRPRVRAPRPADPLERDSPRRDPVLARYYANLEVPYGADLKTVHEAWKGLLRKYHPDLHSADPERWQTGTELVKQLNHAYEELRKRLEAGAAGA
ncbi:MAG: J domain-containing protein [bacterium]|nr:J domain-containing protein [bacterium]